MLNVFDLRLDEFLIRSFLTYSFVYLQMEKKKRGYLSRRLSAHDKRPLLTGCLSADLIIEFLF